MAPPLVTIYVTSLTSQPKVRQHTELLHRSLKGLEIPYESFDLVMDSDAKTRWQRAKPPGQVIGLPGFLVGGEFIGTMDDFEYAVESATLPEFLKQDVDLASGTLDPDQSLGEAELEKLMREMTDGDLVKLVEELHVGDSVGKVGLMVPVEEEFAAGEKKEEEKEVSVLEKVGDEGEGKAEDTEKVDEGKEETAAGTIASAVETVKKTIAAPVAQAVIPAVGAAAEKEEKGSEGVADGAPAVEGKEKLD
ncbi:hypothetical protein P7C73_g5285, partial [Tremellales sp. Uapishka_1]